MDFRQSVPNTVVQPNRMPVNGLDLANLDRNVKPTDDFYHFANGGWLARNPLSKHPDYARWGTFEELHEETVGKLRAILEEASSAVRAGEPVDIHRKAIGLLYLSGMDEKRADEAGFAPVQEIYRVIAQIERPQDVVMTKGRLMKSFGACSKAIFSFHPDDDEKDSKWVVAHVGQSGLGIGDRDFYVEESKEAIREAYVKHVGNILALSGVPEAEAYEAADKIMDLETKMARVSLTRTEMRDPIRRYNKLVTIKDLASKTSTSEAINWQEFFDAIGLETEFGPIIVDNPAFFTEVGKLLSTVDLSVWKMYLRWHATHELAKYLGSDVVKEDFAFYGKTMTGQEDNKARFKRVQSHVGRLAEESLGILFVERHFSPSAKQMCLDMVQVFKTIFERRIKDLDWMEDATKSKALEKLACFRPMIGYPDKWETDYIPDMVEKLDLDAPYVTNVCTANVIKLVRDVRRVNKPTDPDRWEMPPFMVNAYFHPTKNVICFPAAILQEPFVFHPTEASPHGDPPITFSAIGSIICHEISHGYDDQGRKYDAKGELNNWWTERDSAEYERRAQKVVEQYNEYQLFGHNINGKLCLGENVADVGGVKLAFAGLKLFMEKHGRLADIDGFTPEQRFFLGWATIWRNEAKEEDALKRLVMDPHSPGMYRANGPLHVLQEFHQAFGCKEGDKMYRTVDKEDGIW